MGVTISEGQIIGWVIGAAGAVIVALAGSNLYFLKRWATSIDEKFKEVVDHIKEVSAEARIGREQAQSAKRRTIELEKTLHAQGCINMVAAYVRPVPADDADSQPPIIPLSQKRACIREVT